MEPPVLSTSTWSEKLRGWAFSISMMVSALFGCVYILTPLSPLVFFRPRLFRVLVDRLVGFWLVLPSGIMEYLFGVNVHVTGDVIDHATPALIIMNHRTRLDWLFFWNALFRIDPWLLTSEKISLKAILRFLGPPSWAMATNAFMFLERSFTADQPRIDALIDYYANVGDNYQLLLFPEGTDKCPIATARSQKFAEKTGLHHYDYVLHPRTTGFIHILQKMRKVNYVDYIYDVTVAYSDAIVQSEVDLVSLGLSPKEVHFDIRRISVKEVPTTDEGLDEWIKKLWANKEERLRKFYSGDKPFGCKLPTLPNAKTFEFTPYVRSVQLLIITVWSLLTLSWIYAFFAYPLQGYWTLFVSLVFIGSQYFYGGFEVLMTEQARKFREREEHNTAMENGKTK